MSWLTRVGKRSILRGFPEGDVRVSQPHVPRNLNAGGVRRPSANGALDLVQIESFEILPSITT